jgi:hypothetical protein
MNPEDVTRLLKLSEENNTLLKKMRKGQIIQIWIRGVYLFLLLAFFYGGYLFVKTYLQDTFTSYAELLSVESAAVEKRS